MVASLCFVRRLATARLLPVLLCLILGMGAIAPAGVVLAQAPERIFFPPGATSVNVGGALENGDAKSYVLRALAGQTMTVGAAYVAYPYQISVSDANGALLGAANAGASWTGVLPTNGDYYLTIEPGTDSASVFYNFVLSIVSSAQPTPQPTVAPNIERIYFAPGATTATIYGSVAAGAPRQYVLRALAGQNMTVQTNSSGPFRLTLSGADGSVLGYTDANQPLTAPLPRTQDCYIYLQAPAGSSRANYTLQVTVANGGPAPTATPLPRPQTQRITFAPGAISATVDGYVNVTRPASYVLRALAGQDMTVQFYGGGPYRATLTGADGSFLGAANSGAAINTRLPRTQDYYITVNAPADAPASNFTMVITVVGAAQRPTPPAPTTERITFARGEVSAIVYGATPQNYVLKALRGQTMYVELFTNSGAPAQVRIVSANDQPLGSASQSAAWSGTLPATQDYYLRVASPAGAGSASFTLRVTIY